MAGIPGGCFTFFKKNPTESRLFGFVILTRNGYRIAFDGFWSWRFDDEFPRNVVIIGVGNILRYSENRKDSF